MAFIFVFQPQQSLEMELSEHFESPLSKDKILNKDSDLRFVNYKWCLSAIYKVILLLLL